MHPGYRVVEPTAGLPMDGAPAPLTVSSFEGPSRTTEITQTGVNASVEPSQTTDFGSSPPTESPNTSLDTARLPETTEFPDTSLDATGTPQTTGFPNTSLDTIGPASTISFPNTSDESLDVSQTIDSPSTSVDSVAASQTQAKDLLSFESILTLPLTPY